MNTIFKKTHFRGKDDENSLSFGTSPLSRVGGMLIKDLPHNEKKNKLELYRPPGIVKKVKYIQKEDVKSQFDENDVVLNSVPSSKVYIRNPGKHVQIDEDVKPQRSALYTDPNAKKHKPTELEKKLKLPITLKPVSEIEDYLELYDTDYPAEYNDLANASKEQNEDDGKEKDIIEMRKKAEKRYKEVKNLLPKESVIRDMVKHEKY